MSWQNWPLQRAEQWITTPAKTGWPADGVVISFCLAFVVTIFLPQTLNDPDTWWQIATGRWIIDHRAIPSTDPFSFTAGTRRWFAHEWLAEPLMALAWRAGGMPGVMVLTGLASGMTAAVLMHHLRRFLPGIYATAALTMVFYCVAPSLLARPHVLAWPLLALWCGGLVAARAKARAPSFALLPVMLVWVNLHGSFFFGLLLPAAFMLEAVSEAGVRRVRLWGAWLVFVAASWAVALLNPDFVDGLVFPLHLIRMANLGFVQEWHPPDFSRLQAGEVMICGLLALGLSGRLRLSPVRLIVMIGLVHMTLEHARNQPLLGIAGVLILAGPFAALMQREGEEPLRAPLRRLARVAPAIAGIALAARFVVPLGPERSGAAFSDLLHRVPQELLRQPVLNEYGLGGRLIFSGVRPFIDGRTDLYGDEFVRRYGQVMALDADTFASVVAEYAIRWTVFSADVPIVRMLDREPGWHRLLSGDGLVMHIRDN